MKLIPPSAVPKLRRIIRESRQFIIDTEWWNNNRLDAKPMDCEDARLIVTKAQQAMDAALCGDGDAYDRLTTELADLGRSAGGGA